MIFQVDLISKYTRWYLDSEADSRSSLCGIEDIPGVEGGGPGKVQTCVPCDTAVQNKSGRQDQQLSSDRPQVTFKLAENINCHFLILMFKLFVEHWLKQLPVLLFTLLYLIGNI